MSAGASPQTQLGAAYSTPPDPLAAFKGAASRQDGNGGGGSTGRRGEGKVRERGVGKEGKREKLGEGIAPWSFGGIDAPDHHCRPQSLLVLLVALLQ